MQGSTTKRANGYTVIRSGDILKVGKDLADAVTGQLRSRGEIEVRSTNPKRLTWVSTADCVTSERILRRSVENEGHHVSFFMSQGLLRP